MSTTLLDIAQAMFGVEGTSSTNINHRNNNPGNLIYVGQAGATLGEGGFAKFATWDAGQAAAITQINLDLTRGHDARGRPTTTLSQLINSWSPGNASGNTQASTDAYVATVASKTGIDPNASLTDFLLG